MNFPLLTCNPLASHHAEIRDERANDWFAGEAWVTPHPLDSKCVGVANPARGDDLGNDWIPL